ncbi:MAG: RNA methylase, partial [Chloroflexota bacterium]
PLPHGKFSVRIGSYFHQFLVLTMGGTIAITSPPYATALPYIDTQRLSLVWLGLCQPNQLRHLEAELTGSREISGKNKTQWKQRLQENEDHLTGAPYKLCMDLANALTDDDGFRRQAVPLLMYRYFYNMREMFEQVKLITKKEAPFALVVGHNRTTLGGKVFDLDTPAYLKEIAEACGWQHIESYPLQTYQRYDIHKTNSVKLETLLVLNNV